MANVISVWFVHASGATDYSFQFRVEVMFAKRWKHALTS